MLRELYIRNYTLIQELRLTFDQGLTVITGETGAGKSILLGALSLILGKRAETDVLMEKDKACIIEGEFLVKEYDLLPFFKTHDLEYADHTLLRREISPTGKSRAFINDSPVTLQTIKELGDQLVDIHSQHRTLTLNQADVQLALLDDFSGLRQLASQVHDLYKTWHDWVIKRTALEEIDRMARRDQDYKAYLLAELEAADLKELEISDLEQDIDLLRNQESVRASLWQAYYLLSENEASIVGLTSRSHQELDHAGRFLPLAGNLAQRLETTRVELQDIADEARALHEKIEDDPQRILEIEQRLNLLHALIRKHDVRTESELIETRTRLMLEQKHFVDREEEIQILSREIELAVNRLNVAAKQLTEARKSNVDTLEQTILSILHELGMPQARLTIKLEPSLQIGPYGNEQVRFLFNANRGGDLAELAKVASGGERSRFMLAVKSCITSRNLLPTIIFDEIDTGISGEIATRVADRLEEMGKRMQVIAITHLPQLAAKGSKHFLVQKSLAQDRTITTVKNLEDDERIVEIAKMISGSIQSEASRITARDLLGKDMN